MKKSKILFIIAMAAIIFLVASNAATAYLLISKGHLLTNANKKAEVAQGETCSAPTEDQSQVQAIDQHPSQIETPALGEETSTASTAALEKPAAYDEGYILKNVYVKNRPKFSIPIGMKNVVVDYWYKGESVKAEDFFTTDYKTIATMMLGDYKSLLSSSTINQDGASDGWNIYPVGVISSTSAKYAGQNIYEVDYWQSSGEGPGAESDDYGFVVADKEAGRLYLLSRYVGSDAVYKDLMQKNIFTADPVAYIAEMENPETISLPGSSVKLERASSDYLPFFNNSGTASFNYVDPNTYILDSSNGKKVYLEADGCFIVYNENGGHSVYDINLPVPVTYVATVLDVTFNDGSKNKLDYVSQPQGGCGSHGCASLAKFDATTLKVIGKFGNGDNAYGHLTPDENNKDEILWKTPLKDYYLYYDNAANIEQAECGKPVIYLYPTKKTDVKVQVTPNGGFSVTDPIYGKDGWRVSADPQSNLYNYTDGKNYPYLFWEGKAIFYQRPTEGFVVARENVDSFLSEKLAKLGLLPKEIKDFKEFWVPKFTEKPYYFITFLPKSDFDKLAPLNVSPKPQTVIRVFMDYQGLDAPINVVEPKIVTPKRVGFTVVEWGGALNRK